MGSLKHKFSKKKETCWTLCWIFNNAGWLRMLSKNKIINKVRMVFSERLIENWLFQKLGNPSPRANAGIFLTPILRIGGRRKNPEHCDCPTRNATAEENIRKLNDVAAYIPETILMK